MASAAEENYHPSIVGNTFMRQYYQLLAKEPQSLHRFYKDESRWSHTTGSQMQEPIAGQKAINEQILKRGYAGARVDLDIGSIDCQASLDGGVFVLVTGVMTLVDSIVPKPFVQTFFLAVQPKGYFVLNDCLRFLELPGASPASIASATDAPIVATPAAPASVVKEAKKTQAAIGTPVAQSPAAKASPKPQSPVKTAAPAASTPAAAKEKTPASPAAAPASPVKSKTPVTQSPVKTTAAPKSAPRDASPVKKTAPAAEKKPVEAAAVTSPKAAAPLSPVKVQPAAPAPAPVPAAPSSWAALFTATQVVSAVASPPAAPASMSAAKAATPAPVSATVAPAKQAPAATTASPKAAGKANDIGGSKEKTRYFSLYIKEVPAQTKDSDMRELFKSYGSIANVNIIASRNCAFVDYYEEGSMRAALAEGNEFKLFDKTLSVDERTDRKEQRGGFRNDTRSGRGGGRGPKGGRAGGDRKERGDEQFKEPRRTGENGNTANGSNFGSGGRGGANSSGPRSDRRDKGSRRGGKVDSSSARTE
ncbi:Ras gtpase-activating protein-binding protein, partial [Globisporangium splendens]